MMKMFKTHGRIEYAAKRNFRDDKRNNWWATLEVPNFEEIGKYFRWYLDKEWYEHDRIRGNKIPYHRPSHPYHVSLIRGEKPKKNIDKWGTYMKGQRVEIEYDWPHQVINPPSGNGFFWVCPVHISVKNDIREFFGLPTKTHDGKAYTAHLTMARAFLKGEKE